MNIEREYKLVAILFAGAMTFGGCGEDTDDVTSIGRESVAGMSSESVERPSEGTILKLVNTLDATYLGMSYCDLATVEQVPDDGFGGRYLVESIDFIESAERHPIRVSLARVESITDGAPEKFVLGNNGVVGKLGDEIVAQGTLAMNVGEELVIFTSRQSLTSDDTYYLSTSDRIVRASSDRSFRASGWPDGLAKSSLDDVVSEALVAYDSWKAAGKPKPAYVENPFYTASEWEAMEGRIVQNPTWCPCDLAFDQSACSESK